MDSRQQALTVYANIANIKLTQAEFILEFGAVFPDQPPAPGKPMEFEPDVRVVMALPALKTFADTCQTAVAQLEKAQAALQTGAGQVASKA